MAYWLDQYINHYMAESDETYYAVAYKWEIRRTDPPRWAFWRKPVVTREEVQQPGRMPGRFEKSNDQHGNPELKFMPLDPNAVPWKGMSKISIVTEGGTELAWEEF